MNSAKRVLVTGGAGYIGSHTVRALVEKGYEPVVLDSLIAGHRQAVPDGVPLVVGAVGDERTVARTWDEHGPFYGCIHFAGHLQVGESVSQPLKYYQNNVAESCTLLSVLRERKLSRFVFSSTAAVYGNVSVPKISEDEAKDPLNPYGRSKWMLEQILADCCAAYPDFGAISLRYFNASGAATTGEIGEDRKDETHLIPLVLFVPLGKREKITVFGDDYPTPDGTCIRDYIHVEDLALAHLLALEAVSAGQYRAYNVGTGTGASVREVIDAAERITGSSIHYALGARRPGDPASLVADSSRLQAELGWKPAHTSLDEIVGSAWRWHRAHPDGFASVESAFNDPNDSVPAS